MRLLALALLTLGLITGGPVFSLAQGDVNATIPGEGYQGWPGTYGGQKILQYCYFNRFLGEPFAGKTMHFEFKACAPDNHPMAGDISWGDGATTHLERIICGRWRVPHIYQRGGDFSANIKIENESCQGTAAPATITPPQSCTRGVICTCFSSALCPTTGGCDVFDKCDRTKDLTAEGKFLVNGQPIVNVGAIQPGDLVTFSHPEYPITSCSLDQSQPQKENGACVFPSTTYVPPAFQLAKNPVPPATPATSQLALAISAAPLQKNYPLVIGIGAVLLAAVLGIGYIVRKLD